MGTSPKKTRRFTKNIAAIITLTTAVVSFYASPLACASVTQIKEEKTVIAQSETAINENCLAGDSVHDDEDVQSSCSAVDIETGDDSEDDDDYYYDEDEDICKDDDEGECQDLLLKEQECKEATTMQTCRSSCGVCDAEEASRAYGVKQIISGKLTSKMMIKWQETQLYMSRRKEEEKNSELLHDDNAAESSDGEINAELSEQLSCQNHEEECLKWAVEGDCEPEDPDDEAYMVINCSPVCQTCHLESPCNKFMKDRVPALQPGDLNNLFEQIAVVSDEYNELISDTDSDDYADENNNDDDDDAEWVEWIKQYQPKVLSFPSMTHDDDPWVIVLDNFLTSKEAQHFIRAGFKIGFEQSYTSELNEYGIYEDSLNDYRTSQNTWYAWDGHRVAKRVMERIERVTGLPIANTEGYQLLKYEEGEYYGNHHDFSEDQLEEPAGPRILTFFLYLNDVEEGGGTRFGTLNNLTITPKTGRAVIWPSVLDDDPMQYDETTFHEAMPVIKGRKFGSNVWYHLYDHHTPGHAGC